MDTLPTELHAYICQLVCDDDGTTIRTLSSVSKYFNQVTKPYLYRSICATGTSQIMALVERLDSIPSHLRPVERLFLSDTSCKTAPTTSLSSPKGLTDRETRYINRLIALSAPTLNTFTFIATSPFSGTSLIARVFRTSFPSLVNLTVSGFYPFPSTPGRFPMLNYLHLDGNRNPHGLFQMSSLEDACPSLRNLKVTGLGAAGAFVVELEEALAFGKNLDERSDYMAHSRLPSCLCEITLQAGPELAVSGSRDSAATKDQILMKRLQSVKALSSESLQVSVVERSSRPLILDDFRLEWIQNW